MRPSGETKTQRESIAISCRRGHESHLGYRAADLDLVDSRNLQPRLAQSLKMGDPKITNPYGLYLTFRPAHKVDEVPPRIHSLFRAHERSVDEEEVNVVCLGEAKRSDRECRTRTQNDVPSSNDSKRCDQGSSGLAYVQRETSSREQEGKRIERGIVEPMTYPNPDHSNSSRPFSYTPPPYALPLALWSL